MRRAAPGPIGLVGLALLAASCEEPTLVAVHVSGPIGDLRALGFSVERPGSPRVLSSGTITRRLEEFHLRVPAAGAGPYQVKVRGIEKDGCPGLEGAAPFTARPGQREDVAVDLQPRGDGPCSVSVRLLGEAPGLVRSAPAAASSIDCAPRCEARLPPGAALRLVADPGAGYFVGWTGACTGADACDLVGREERAAVTAVFAPRQICNDTPLGALCWEHPLPTGNHLSALLAVSANEAWAVGRNGLILRRIGSLWFRVPSPVSESLWDLWASGPDDVWIVGAGEVILHFDGTELKVVQTSRGRVVLHGVQGIRGPDGWELWIAGLDGGNAGPPGVLLQRAADGSMKRTEVQDCALTDVAGSSREELRMAGSCLQGGKEFAAILSRQADGTLDRALFPNLPGDRLERLAILDRTHAFAVGRQGSILGSEGQRWRQEASGTAYNLYDVAARSPEEVYAVGDLGTLLRRDGAVWRAQDSRSIVDLRAVSVSGQRDAWFAGRGGTLLRWNGASLLPESTTAQEHIYGLHGDGEEAFAVDYGGVVRRRAGGAWLIEPGSGSVDTLYAVAWTGSGGPWAAGRNGVSRYDGSRFVLQAYTGIAMGAIWADANEVWSVGDKGTIVHRRDGAFVTLAGPATANLLAVTRSASGEVWAAGTGGALVRIQGDAVTSYTVTGMRTAYAIWAAAPDDLWLAGDTIQRIRGGVLTPVPGAPGVDPRPFRAIFGRAADDIWFAGGEGRLYHFDGAALAYVETRTGSDLYAVTGIGERDLLLAGENTAILRLHRR